MAADLSGAGGRGLCLYGHGSVLDQLTIRPEVAQVTTSLMFEHYRSRPQPLRTRGSR